jgi:hypothetical protein
VEGVADVPTTADCVVAGDGRGVDLTAGGVVLRPENGSQKVAEVTLIYVPDGDSITVVTPPLAPLYDPGMAFEVTPTGAGTFVLDADGRGGRPRLTLQAGPQPLPPGGGSQVLSAVEGGGVLALRSTLDGRSDATLQLANVGDIELPPLELTMAWPAKV